MSRCTGHCCERFNLKFSPSEFARLREGIDLGQKFVILDNGTVLEHLYPPEEVIKVTDMIVPLYESNVGVDGEVFSVKEWHSLKDLMERGFKLNSAGELVAHFYTCKHYKDGNCTNYENRPMVCRDHGVHSACGYKQCTFKKD